jgi:hypothetical protein
MGVRLSIGVCWGRDAHLSWVWQLYVAHVFLFMQFMATVAYLVDDLNNAIYAEEFRTADFSRSRVWR